MAKRKQEIAKREPEQKTELVSMERNFFETYGSQMTVGSSITGSLLKFNKGDWLSGQDEEEIDDGTKLAACMDQLMVGWVKWEDNKPVEQLMGAIADGFQPKRRGELGDMDEADWETGSDGKVRDPWQFTNYLVMKTPGKKADAAEVYTFATSSRSGLSAVGALCKLYGKESRTRPDQYPIVALGSDYYDHKEFGRIKTPTFEVVGWEAKKLFDQQ